jgi:hypothetical protein
MVAWCQAKPGALIKDRLHGSAWTTDIPSDAFFHRVTLLQQCNTPSKSIQILRLLLKHRGQASPRMLRFCLINSVSSTLAHPPMKASSPEHRVRSWLMRFSLWTSALTFFVIEGYFLHDQLEIGHASAMFMLSTAFVIAGFCIGLFAMIGAIGLAISAAFSDEPPEHQEPSGGTGPINHRGNPRTYAGVKPNPTRHPALLSKSKRHFRRLGF